jgi:hypothetical protein
VWRGSSPLAAESTPDDRREFGARLHALKRRLHPLTLHPDLPALYTRYHDAASPEDKVALGKDIVRVQRTIDDTEHASVFGAIDRAFAEVGNGQWACFGTSAVVVLYSLNRSSLIVLCVHLRGMHCRSNGGARSHGDVNIVESFGDWPGHIHRIRVRFFSPAG